MHRLAKRLRTHTHAHIQKKNADYFLLKITEKIIFCFCLKYPSHNFLAGSFYLIHVQPSLATNYKRCEFLRFAFKCDVCTCVRTICSLLGPCVCSRLGRSGHCVAMATHHSFHFMSQQQKLAILKRRRQILL